MEFIYLLIFILGILLVKLSDHKELKRKIKYSQSPIGLKMAVNYEHAKFRIRYRNLEPSQELYKIGLRDGQYGVILKCKSGMYAKTTVDGKCHFVPISHYNYIPMG